MKLWWGTQDYNGIVVAANSLQDALSCIQKTKHFDRAKINPNSIGFINSTEVQAYVICNSNPTQHEDYDAEPDDAFDDEYGNDKVSLCEGESYI